MTRRFALAVLLALACAAPGAAQEKELTPEQRERLERARAVTEDGAQAAGAGLAVTVILIIGYVCVTMIPTAIAFARGHHNAVPILLVNLVTGWTCIGFFACLAWSLTATEVPVATRYEREGPRRRRRDGYDD